MNTSSPHDIHLEEWLLLRTKAGLGMGERLEEIHRDLTQYVREQRPDLAVVEKLFFETNVKTAMDVAQARGVILLALQQAAIPLLEVTPLQVKSAITGDGKADKRQVQDMVMRILKLSKRPSDDAADALAMAAYGALHSRTVMTRISGITDHYPVSFDGEEGWRAAGGEGEGPASTCLPTSQPRNLGGAGEEAQGRAEGGSARRRLAPPFRRKRWHRKAMKTSTHHR